MAYGGRYNPEELESIYGRAVRRVVREELDDLYLVELKPPSGVKSIAFPTVFRWIDGSEKVIFSDDDDNIYVADIDKDLSITNPVKLPFNGKAPSIIFDGDVERWYILVYVIEWRDTWYGFYVMDRDMKKVLAYQKPLLIDGTIWYPSGHGFLLLGSNLYAFINDAYKITIAIADLGNLWDITPIINFRSSKYPVSVWSSRYHIGATGPIYPRYHIGASGPIYLGDQLIFLITIDDIFGRGLVLAYSTFDPEKEHWTTGVNYDYIIAPPTSAWDEYGASWIWGSLTNLLGRHTILFLTEADLYRTPYYKTYAFRMPWWLLSPHNKKLTYTLWYNTSVSAGETSPAMPGWGRKTIHFTSDTAGDLTAYLDAIGTNDWKPVLTRSAVTSVVDQISYSGLRFRLGFSATANVTAHVVVEP